MWGRGEEGYAILRYFSPRGLGTPEIKIALVPVPAFTGNKMASRNLQIREEEQLSDRPEPAQIAKDRNTLNVIQSNLVITNTFGTRKSVRITKCRY